jgi:hypothetical protein
LRYTQKKRHPGAKKPSAQPTPGLWTGRLSRLVKAAALLRRLGRQSAA